MNESNPETEGGTADATPAPTGHFEILKIYAKDISFETPNSPAMFRVEWKPNINLNLNSAAQRTAPGEYEVVLSVTVTVTIEERTAFLAEVQSAGIFAITGLTDDELAPVLGSLCPGILYPYAREMVSDLTSRGGFPQCILSPVNFDALYRQQQAAEAQEGQADSAVTQPHAGDPA